MTPEEWETTAQYLEWDAQVAREEPGPEALLYVCGQATQALHRAEADWPAELEPERRFACLRRLDRLGRRGVAAAMAARR